MIMEKFLVTGSSGFIGKNISDYFWQNGLAFTSFDLSNGQDITNAKHLHSMPKHDVVFHLAAKIRDDGNAESIHKVNVEGTKNVLDYCRLNDASLVFPSTYVYGNPKYLPIDEAHPVQPENNYKKSKLQAEEMCREYSEKHGLKITILRIFNPYGKYQPSDFIISRIISQLNNSVIELFDPAPRRDFIHVSDIVSAFIASQKQKTKFEIFNIGSGKSASVKELVDLILKIAKKNLKVVYKNVRRENEIMDCYANIS